MPQSNSWALTLGSWTAGQRELLRSRLADLSAKREARLYAIRVDGAGMPLHTLQAFVVLKGPQRTSWLERHVLPGIWLPARGPRSCAERRAVLAAYDEGKDIGRQGVRAVVPVALSWTPKPPSQHVPPPHVQAEELPAEELPAEEHLQALGPLHHQDYLDHQGRPYFPARYCTAREYALDRLGIGSIDATAEALGDAPVEAQGGFIGATLLHVARDALYRQPHRRSGRRTGRLLWSCPTGRSVALRDAVPRSIVDAAMLCVPASVYPTSQTMSAKALAQQMASCSALDDIYFLKDGHGRGGRRVRLNGKQYPQPRCNELPVFALKSFVGQCQSVSYSNRLYRASSKRMLLGAGAGEFRGLCWLPGSG